MNQANEVDLKQVLHRYLRAQREALLWKLDGLSERDVRRPMTGTGTNLLGLLKHSASVESGYLGLARHAGQADILRETIDGQVGMRADNSNLPDHDAAFWGEHVARLQRIADASTI